MQVADSGITLELCQVCGGIFEAPRRNPIRALQDHVLDRHRSSLLACAGFTCECADLDTMFWTPSPQPLPTRSAR